MSHYHRESRAFEPDNIFEALKKNMGEGLRALADAIDNGEILGRPIVSAADGFGPGDTINVRVVMQFSAPYTREWFEVPKLHLPVQSDTGIRPMEPTGGQQQ
jgi:hypothetical protein